MRRQLLAIGDNGGGGEHMIVDIDHQGHAQPGLGSISSQRAR